MSGKLKFDLALAQTLKSENIFLKTLKIKHLKKGD